jgi:putative nucleotidyltransferase with HDIG domain
MKIRAIAMIFLLATLNASGVQTPEQVVEDIMAILQQGAAYDYIGEPISQLEHALQCAQRAKNANADDETIVAALLHDIGHLLVHDDTNGLGAADHEKIGAAYVLEKGFSQKIADLIRGHVDAKRYLTFVNPTYYERLSSASKETLILQGGPMDEAQALEFEQQPYFKDKLLLRTWDEQSKLLNYIVDSLESYRELLLKVLTLYQAAHYKKYCEYV